jgi:hypothetical protein
VNRVAVYSVHRQDAPLETIAAPMSGPSAAAPLAWQLRHLNHTWPSDDGKRI